MKVELIDVMGSDLTVVNAARVSFNKNKEVFEEGDEKLIRYLAVHGHWTPFGHPQLQFRIKAPVFVARQLVKHQIGLVWNEVSRRYVDYVPEFYLLEEHNWRKRPQNKKQGSSTEMANLEVGILDRIKSLHREALELYQLLVNDNDVAPELARIILPQSMYTEWYWTGSLYAFARICNLRIADDAQEETRQVAQLISELAEKHFPVCWKYLVQH